MDARMTAILSRMFSPGAAGSSPSVLDPDPWLAPDADPIARLAAAFLVAASGPAHATYPRAMATLAAPSSGSSASDSESPEALLAAFYRDGLERMSSELARVIADDPSVAARLDQAVSRLSAERGSAWDDGAADEGREALWTAFFPQAVGLLGHEEERIAALRAARTVTIVSLAMDPLTDPAREVLFTSNVLLTVPSATTDVADLPYPPALREAIDAAAVEPQRYWFDHPIQLGVEPGGNELLYGLRMLDAAIDAEPRRGRVTCLLSVSVTHDGLGPIARPYVRAELARSGGLRHVDVVVVTERDSSRLVDEVIVPALGLTPGESGAAAAQGIRDVFGVDGEYGRHYSFLKAIAALWHVAVDPGVRATFKFDLDQVFPQDVLVGETGQTAFGHLATPLWGASAIDSEGRPVDLGMLAGALVNERDIGRGLFTPDVAMPIHGPALDEYVFWSALPQAVSTRAEMMERYDGPAVDGVVRALERVHVTGGTNGIRVDALRRHRPFTPTFVGRAEDQAYILSALGRPGPRLAYAHAAGLIMRHDKEAFAGEAIAAAHVGKLIGDDLRILLFSAYADVAAGAADGPPDGALDRAAIGRLLDPFSGSFVSALPHTVVLLRMALRTIRLLAAGEADEARQYATEGAMRVGETLAFSSDRAAVSERVAAERTAWGHYYDAIDALEAGLGAGSERARELASRAMAIIDGCRIVMAPPTG